MTHFSYLPTYLLAGPALFLLACSGLSRLPAPGSPATTPVLIRFAAQTETFLADHNDRPAPLTFELTLTPAPVTPSPTSVPSPTPPPSSTGVSLPARAAAFDSLRPPPPTATPEHITGNIILLNPAPGTVLPVSLNRLEFKWAWQGETPRTCYLPAGYGFELRIWPRQPGFGPLGVMDAVAAQDQIACEPATGIRSYTVPDLHRTPGLRAAYTGKNRWDGRFWWDVALVRLDPYRPAGITAPPHDFEMSLTPYSGPFDPAGARLKCTDFNSWPEAQAVFLAAGGPARDPHELDPDGNQLACDDRWGVGSGD